jgi:hypothetical protein
VIYISERCTGKKRKAQVQIPSPAFHSHSKELSPTPELALSKIGQSSGFGQISPLNQ